QATPGPLRHMRSGAGRSALAAETPQLLLRRPLPRVQYERVRRERGRFEPGRLGSDRCQAMTLLEGLLAVSPYTGTAAALSKALRRCGVAAPTEPVRLSMRLRNYEPTAWWEGVAITFRRTGKARLVIVQRRERRTSDASRDM